MKSCTIPSNNSGLSVLAILIFLGLLLGCGYFGIGYWAHKPQNILQGSSVVTVPANVSLGNFSALLGDAGIVDSPILFKVYVRLFDDFRLVQAGTYKFDSPIAPIDVMATIRAGKIYQPIVLEYAIPEGFNWKQIRDRLVARGVGDESEFKNLWSDKSLLTELKIPSTNMEGFFYPATYRYTKMINMREALTDAAKKFWSQLPASYASDVKKRGLNLLGAVTFASLIEIETRIEEEKPLVSEVIWRRLKRGEPIGIDAALIYGIKNYQGDIKTIHLKDPKNLYNTRIHKGLPPTPIGSPSLSSLLAVLNPSNEGYYYYVRDINTEDRHAFSRTKAEHDALVKRLVEKTKKRTQH